MTTSSTGGQPEDYHYIRVRNRIAEWRKAGASRKVLSWIERGVPLQWQNGPPQPFHHGVSRFTPSQQDWLATELPRCLGTGAWRYAQTATHVSRAFIVEHNGKLRLVFNLKHINEYCKKHSVRYEPLSAMRRDSSRYDWMWSIDLTDAYHHIGVREEDVKYFTFELEIHGVVHRLCTPTLNFGWTNSPAIFTECCRVPVRYCRTGGVTGNTSYNSRAVVTPEHAPVRVRPWLDDFAFAVSGERPPDDVSSPEPPAHVLRSRDHTLQVFDRLGLQRHATKGEQVPKMGLDDYLGFKVDTRRGLFLLTPRRVLKLRKSAHTILRMQAQSARCVPARALAAFQGLAQSSYLALPRARCWLRSSYDDLATMKSWRHSVCLSAQSVRDVRQFTTLHDSPYVGRAIWLEPESAELSSDAGPYGWGGKLWRPQSMTPAWGFWTAAEAAMHITWRELRAVRLLVEWYAESLRSRKLLLWEDNTAVVHIITNMVSRSPELMRELKLLLDVLELIDCEIVRAVYIRSAENKVADFFSRVAAPRDYHIRQTVFDGIMQTVACCTVDAFASVATARLPRYWTQQHEPGAEATDAFAQRWADEIVWAHPQPWLLPRVEQYLRAQPLARALVCVPTWPHEPWYAQLRQLADEELALPPGVLRRDAFDAPQRLESWAMTIFVVLRGTTARPLGTRCS